MNVNGIILKRIVEHCKGCKYFSIIKNLKNKAETFYDCALISDKPIATVRYDFWGKLSDLEYNFYPENCPREKEGERMNKQDIISTLQDIKEDLFMAGKKSPLYWLEEEIYNLIEKVDAVIKTLKEVDTEKQA